MYRDITYIDDVVYAIRKIITKVPDEEGYRIYNIGSGQLVKFE